MKESRKVALELAAQLGGVWSVESLIENAKKLEAYLENGSKEQDRANNLTKAWSPPVSGYSIPMPGEKDCKAQNIYDPKADPFFHDKVSLGETVAAPAYVGGTVKEQIEAKNVEEKPYAYKYEHKYDL